MAKRPRLNLKASHFEDSYNSEVLLLEKQCKVVKEFVKMQMESEFMANKDIRESLEKTYRLIYDQIDNKW